MARDSLDSWKLLYSCQVPFDYKGGQVSLSRLEGLVAEAGGVVKSVMAAMVRNSEDQSSPEESWLRWPLVPALSQLAERLRSAGRFSESLHTWRRAERAAASVVPHSNIHLRVISEMLLVQAQRGAEKHMASALRESRAAIAAAYGGGLSVWLELVGFRMPTEILTLAQEAVSNFGVKLMWCDVEAEEDTHLRRAKIIAQSEAFIACSAVQLDASPSAVVVAGCGDAAGSGADPVRLHCPFRIDVDSLRPRFFAKRRELVINVVEAVEGRMGKFGSEGYHVCTGD